MRELPTVVPPEYVIYGLHLGDHRYRYIGLTSRGAAHRLKAHSYSVAAGSTYPVHNWMRKYGTDLIHTTVLDTSSSIEDLCVKEIHWIKQMRLDGYDLLNLSDGGQGGINPSLEVREKIAASKRGKSRPPELMKKIGDRRRGSKASEETRAKMSKAHTGRTHSLETRKKISQIRTGRTHSAETKRKISELHQGNTYRLGIPHSEETKQKISDAKKAQSVEASLETRRRISDATKGRAPTKGPHIQWHANKNISKPETCTYCKETIDKRSNQLESH